MRACDTVGVQARTAHGRTGGNAEPDGPEFRRVAGAFATGVTVITTARGGAFHGCAANAVTSVSLDPPMMLVCLDHGSTTLGHLMATGVFAINVLADSGEGRRVCGVFASKRADKFTGIGHRPGVTGAPLLEPSTGWIECEVTDAHTAGDHRIIVGRVRAVGHRDAEPLLFYRGDLRSIHPE